MYVGVRNGNNAMLRATEVHIGPENVVFVFTINDSKYVHSSVYTQRTCILVILVLFSS